MEDWEEIKKFYGIDKIKKTVVTLSELDAKTLNFASFFFNIPKTRFRCYIRKQYTQKHFPY